jgi:hypothetical protein
MSDRGRHARPRAATPERAPRRSRAIGPALVIAGLAAAGLAGMLRWRSPAHPRPERTDDAVTLEPADAYREAYRLMAVNHLRESLPYFRRAAAGVSVDFCEVHYLYGVALGALSMQYSPRAGLPVPATRSSAERVSLVRESLGELNRAAALARGPKARATVLRYRAEVLTAWGLPWDAMFAWHEARVADSTDRSLMTEAARYLAVLRNPGHRGPGSSSGPPEIPAAPPLPSEGAHP